MDCKTELDMLTLSLVHANFKTASISSAQADCISMKIAVKKKCYDVNGHYTILLM